MKRIKPRSEDLVTEHVAVTQEVFTLLWTLRIQWRCKRLSDVILRLIQGKHRDPSEWQDLVE